jgi:hypothetical protein
MVAAALAGWTFMPQTGSISTAALAGDAGEFAAVSVSVNGSSAWVCA